MSDFLNRIANFSAKRLALLADELNSRVQQLEGQRHEKIAIIGIGCRFPGGVDSLARYWQLLCDGTDAIVEVPADRWNIDEYYDPNPAAPGKMSTRWGGFLGSIDGFDAPFFGISPREAQSMDPQQRLLLEVTWRALEDAAIQPKSLEGSRTGVYLGLSAGDYYQRMRDANGLVGFDAYTASGTAHSIASGRISYTLGLRGPSISIDTACSSSLVAIHQAVQSLRRGDCQLALAGGVNLILGPDITIALSKSHMMAPDGRCKAFDSRADGFVRGEGCGILVLKRLRDAVADGDRVLAVIRGAAVNQDGRSNGLTAPNGPAQEAVIREALADGGIAAHDVGYVEAHGTGTSLGDPIEIQALQGTLCEGRDPQRPLLVGSVKSSIGHLEAAAGVAGVIKAVLVLRHGLVPAQLHLQQLSPHIPWDRSPLLVPRVATAWTRGGGSRVAGVSSFGFSGTNVHLLLEEPPAAAPAAPRPARPLHLMTVSARAEAPLLQLTRSYSAAVSAPDASLVDLCYVANAGRAHFSSRAAIMARDSGEAGARLGQLLAGEREAEGLYWGAVRPRPPRIAFLFTGQGSQYAGMGRTLCDSLPVFREAIDRCDAILRDKLPQPLLTVLYPKAGAASPIDETAWTQPALFALEYALAQMWISWGVRPSAVMGHSIGEYVAACIAGVCTLEDALALVAERGRLMSELPRDGAMASIAAAESRVRVAMTPWAGELDVAAVNGPVSVVVSGRAAALEALLTRLQREGVEATRLKVSHAFHSPQVDPILDAFASAAAKVTWRAPQIEVISNVTGRRAGSELTTSDYWRRHARAPVQFAASMQALAESAIDVFVEIGPHPVLIGMGQSCVSGQRQRWFPSLRRGRDDWATVMDSLARMYVEGAYIDWKAFEEPYRRGHATLPEYPFQRERYWIDASSRVTGASRIPANAATVSTVDIEAMLHEISWRMLPPAVSASAVQPQELAESIRDELPRIAEQCDLHAYGRFLPALDQLVSAYVLQALRQLGVQWNAGTRLSAVDASSLGIQPRHARLFDRMLFMLAEDGWLRREGGVWCIERDGDLPDAEQLAVQIGAAHREGAAELTLTQRCGRQLAAVLRGRSDPLALLFPEGSLGDAERLYRDSPPARAYNNMIGRIVARLAEAVESERPLRILEIGAGTGSTTAHVLPLLAGRSIEYTFTDVSQLFLQRARERFAQQPGMRFSLLDISQPPPTQGFAENRYDIIIGANVLHATPDLGVTLANVRELLVPGGSLVLLEGTRPQRFGDVTVGLLEGWWAYSDIARRTYALMPRAAWLDLFQESGFETASAVPDDDLHPVWSQQSILVARAPTTQRCAKSWIVRGSTSPIVSAFSAALVARGDRVIRLDSPVSTLRAEAGSGISGIVDLTALEMAIDADANTSALMDATRRVLGGQLALVQTLAKLAGSDTPPLWFVTRGAQAVRDEEGADPAQAATWGFSHVVALEHPELRCRRVDLDPAADSSTSVAALLAEIDGAGREDQIAIRNGARLGRRLAKREARAKASRVLPLRSDRSYLVTGGLHGLGLQVAHWLVRRGARHLLLLGRRPPDAAAAAQLRSLGEQGVAVHVLQADVANEPALRAALASVEPNAPPICGIVHSAGALDDGVIAGQNWLRFETPLHAKVCGSWNLHRLALPLDFLVLFSSGASVGGSAGQANHAAANAFEDALAWYRNARGKPTLSINWGPWARIGAAADRQLLLAGGLDPIDPDDGLAALEMLLQVDADRGVFVSPQCAVLRTNWARYLGENTRFTSAALYDELRLGSQSRPAASEAGVVPIAAGAESTPSWREQLLATAANRRRKLLRDNVQSVAGRVLGLSRGSDLPVTESLRQVGLDSLMAVELRNVLGRAVGRTLPATVTFEYPSVEALTDFLATGVLADLLAPESSKVQEAGQAVITPAVVTTAAPRDLDSMGADELALQLKETLDMLGDEDKT